MPRCQKAEDDNDFLKKEREREQADETMLLFGLTERRVRYRHVFVCGAE